MAVRKKTVHTAVKEMCNGEKKALLLKTCAESPEPMKKPKTHKHMPTTW